MTKLYDKDEAKESLYERLHCKLSDDQEQAADDLLEWFNRAAPLEGEELNELANLFNEGRFIAWNCPTCHERVYKASPKNWDSFQGACQVDYASYPAGHPKQCDYCRCHHPDANCED